MADDNALRIGIQVDTSSLQAGMAQGVSVVEASAQKMAASFAEAKTAVKAATDAMSAAQLQFGKAAEQGSEQARAILNQYAAELNSAKAQLAELTAAEEEETAAADANTEAHTRQVSALMATGSSIRVLEGNIMGSNRAAANFLATSLGLGPVLQAAFPVIGALAFGEVIDQITEKMAKFAFRLEDMGTALGGDFWTGLKAELEGVGDIFDNAQKKIAEANVQIQQLQKQTIAANAENVRLTQGQAAADEFLGHQLLLESNFSQERTNQLEKQLAILRQQASETREVFLAGQIITTSTAQADMAKAQIPALERQLQAEDALREKYRIDAVNKSLEQSRSEYSERARQEQAKLASIKAEAEEQARIRENLTTQLYQMGVISSDQELKQLQDAENQKYSVLESYYARARALAASNPDRSAGSAESTRISGESSVAEMQHTQALEKLRQDADRDQQERAKQTEAMLIDSTREQTDAVDRAVKQQMEDWKEEAKAKEEAAKRETEAARESLDEQARLANEQYKQVERNANFEVQMGRMSAEKRLQILRQAADSEYHSELQAIHAKEAIDQDDAEKLQADLNRERQLWQQHTQQVEQINQQAALATKQKWDHYFQTFNNGFRTAINGWLQGTQTIEQAFSKMLNSMLVSLADFVVQYLEKKAEMWLMDEILGASSQTSQVAKTASANVVMATSDAGLAAAGQFAYYSATDPPMAPVMAAAAYAEGMSLASLAAFEKGGIIGGNVGTAVPVMGHAGERVLTVDQTRNFESLVNQNNIRQTGGNVNAHIEQHFHGAKASSSKEMTRAIKTLVRQGKLSFS
jgi:hypothetical protein